MGLIIIKHASKYQYLQITLCFYFKFKSSRYSKLIDVFRHLDACSSIVNNNLYIGWFMNKTTVFTVVFFSSNGDKFSVI